MGIRISKDHLHPSVIESITSLIGDLNQLETTAKGNAVEAINELLANGGNKEELEALIAEIAEGKELIANAVGEPLTAEESFDEMSSDINSLLSQFKTNMMNSGVVVESNDKFKSLIDKIATMAEEGKGKGVNFKIVELDDLDVDYGTIEHTITFDDLGFVPNYGFLFIDKTTDEYVSFDIHNVCLNGYETQLSEYAYMVTLSDLTSSSIKITTNNNMEDAVFSGLKYYAIGVGEEDTTLRDSLASILGDKGVDVTEEDDMASLITKVDDMTTNMIKYKSGIHEYTYDGSTRISFKVTGIGFRPTFVQICRVNKTQTDDGYIFWINNASYMNDSNSILVPVEKSALKSNSYTGLNASAKYNELVVNADGFSLNTILGGTTGDLWHFEWFVLG